MRGGRRGYSLLEVTVVITLMGVILAMTVPSFQRSVETAKADIAVANLRAIWAAERFYWLEYRAYTGDLAQLTALGLLDPEMTAGTAPYVYSVSASADGSAFTATAARAAGSRWAGSFAIDQTGAVTGKVTADDEPDINPPAL
jgi:prepilin-type N-terminal cleavage/methylation domain-containing protein